MVDSSSRSQLAAAVSALLNGPSNPDLVYSHQETTQGEVYAMAAWLREQLPPRQDGVMVCLAAEDKAVVAAAFLASLGGGPVLLLPYAFSAQALAGLQQETGYTVAISDVARDFPPGTRVICPKKGDNGRPLAGYGADPEAELLRLYTGGSTGVPKMWLKTGINIFGESLFLANNFQVTARDRIVATISPYHVYGLLYSITLPLVSGASVVGAMPSFPEEISCTVAESRATILISVPAHYRVLRGKPALGDSLRLAFSSAGPLDPEDNRAFCETNRIGIVEVYGSTETGGVALRNRFVGEDHLTPYPTVGWQIQNEQLRVSSPYLSPNLEKDATGFFTTGDRVEEAGKVGFVLKGRSDSITKVAGNRVDLEEISAFIKSQSGVTDCLVWAIAESGGRQQRIVALIEAEVVDLDGLRRLLGGRFEPYAIPRMIKAVTRMPLKENGKYDRDEIMRLFA